MQPAVVLSRTAGRQHAHEVQGASTGPDRSNALGNASTFLAGYGKHVFVSVILFCVCSWGLSGFQKRSAEESLFRNCVDVAQLIDLRHQHDSFGEKVSNPYWKKAVGRALQLGESKKVVADLYVKAACEELPDDSGRANTRMELEQAVSLYSQVPNTDSQRIKAIDLLVCLVVPQLSQLSQDRDIESFSLNAQAQSLDSRSLAQDLPKKIDAALNHNQLPNALTLCKEYVARFHRSDDVAYPLKIISTQLKVNDPLMPKAIPVFEECVYYGSPSIGDLKDEYLALDSVLKKGGFQADSYAELVKLAHSALAHDDYYGAAIYMQRCLGKHDDTSLRKELLRVRRSIARSDYNLSDEDIHECMEMLKTQRAIQIKAAGEGSQRVITTDRRICYLNALQGNYDGALRLLELDVAKSPIADNVDHLIWDMACIYSAEGDCDSAIQLLQFKIGNRKLQGLVLDCLVNQSALYLQSGRYEKALGLLKSAHKIAADPQHWLPRVYINSPHWHPIEYPEQPDT